MKKALVTGSSGMLGSDAARALTAHGWEVCGISRRRHPDLPLVQQIQADLTDGSGLDRLLGAVAPDLIVHCAAIVNVDACEDDREAAEALHVRAGARLAAFNPGRTRMVYISTDSVHAGEKGDYSETDEPRPCNTYGASKLEGERACLEADPRALVLRTNIYGRHFDKRSSLAEWALGQFEQGREIKGFEDVFFNPAHTGQLAALLPTLVAADTRGVLNVGSGEAVSKYEFLRRLAKRFGHSEKLVLRESVDTIRFAAKRPRNTSLNLERLRSILGWVPSLEDGFAQLYKNSHKEN